MAISKVISSALATTQVPNDAIQLITTRDVVNELLGLEQYIDLVIPRGGNELVRFVKEHTKIPVLGHADGICSVFLEKSADAELAARVIVDSKTTYPAACNSVETLLVEADGLERLLPTVARALLAKGVTLRCDEQSKAVLDTAVDSASSKLITASKPEDYDTEHLALILAVKTVSSYDEAVEHINVHGSHHTDVIITSSEPLAERFMNAIDSAGVFWNTSSRMADGTRFGFGTEVGVSTNKIHARGPVGLEGLMIYKYKLRGQGHLTADYGESEGQRSWKHERVPL